ncbi:hypothetical protein BHE17_14215 [Planococcus maritimus]|nr:hypothetical protein BHE17_14215 [Planococcus maritimus]
MFILTDRGRLWKQKASGFFAFLPDLAVYHLNGLLIVITQKNMVWITFFLYLIIGDDKIIWGVGKEKATESELIVSFVR